MIVWMSCSLNGPGTKPYGEVYHSSLLSGKSNINSFHHCSAIFVALMSKYMAQRHLTIFDTRYVRIHMKDGHSALYCPCFS